MKTKIKGKKKTKKERDNTWIALNVHIICNEEKSNDITGVLHRKHIDIVKLQGHTAIKIHSILAGIKKGLVEEQWPWRVGLSNGWE